VGRAGVEPTTNGLKVFSSGFPMGSRLFQKLPNLLIFL